MTEPTQVVVHQIRRRRSVRLPNGKAGRTGYALSELVEALGGYRGVMLHPKTGKYVDVSLEQWRGHDPETTFLEVGFIWWPSAGEAAGGT